MKLAVAAASLLVAAAVPGALGTSTKNPPGQQAVDPNCPIPIIVPNSNQFIQDKGGYYNINLVNQGTTTVSNIFMFLNLIGSNNAPSIYTNPPGGYVATSSRAGQRHNAKSSHNAPTFTPFQGNPQNLTWGPFSLAPGEKMKIGLPLDINCGVRRSFLAQPRLIYTSPVNSAITCDYIPNNANPSTTPPTAAGTSFIVRVTPCGAGLTSTSSKGKRLKYLQYATGYRVCQQPLNSLSQGTTNQACADACAARSECRSFVAGPFPDGSACKLYKGNPGDGNTRSFLAYTEGLNYTIFMKASTKRALALTGAACNILP